MIETRRRSLLAQNCHSQRCMRRSGDVLRKRPYDIAYPATFFFFFCLHRRIQGRGQGGHAPPPNLTPNKFHERSTGASKMQKPFWRRPGICHGPHWGVYSAATDCLAGSGEWLPPRTSPCSRPSLSPLGLGLRSFVLCS